MPLARSYPAVTLPEGLVVRPYRPGLDDASWLELNSTVFADHPEQGNWDETDLQARLNQEWFREQDFLVVERGGSIVAYNWLKLDESAASGEIYVIGVDSSLRSHGMGRALTVLGLKHMLERGMTQATCYVDGTNGKAVAMYYSLGFVIHHADLCYSRALDGDSTA